MPSLSDDLDNITELRVGGGTPPKELAGSIIHLLNDDKRVRLAAIGHQAVGQAVKAIPVVNQYCVAQGYVITLLPSFSLKAVPNREIEVIPGQEEDPAAASRITERTVTMLTLVKITPQ
jgi:stage V sporulation protein SpoVS